MRSPLTLFFIDELGRVKAITAIMAIAAVKRGSYATHQACNSLVHNVVSAHTATQRENRHKRSR